MGSLWNRSGTIERYADDIKADGAQAFFYQGGTVTPLTVFADSLQADPFPNPVLADANGRWPDVFVPYIINYDVQVKSRYGEQLSFSQRIPNPDPVQQTVIVPPERQVNTGMIHPDFHPGPKTGYVRLNGKTIGDATTNSANSELASDLAKDLFIYLWNVIPIDQLAPVTPGGRGFSADSDWIAHKTIVLPDMRGAMFAGLDDMGSNQAGRFGVLPFLLGNGIIMASILGGNSITLTAENMPAHVHTGTTAPHLGHVHNISGATGQEGTLNNPAIFQNHTHAWGNTTGVSGDGLGQTASVATTYAPSPPPTSHAHTTSASPGRQLGAGGSGGSTDAQAATDITSSTVDVDHVHNFALGGTTSGESVAHVHPFTAKTTALPIDGTAGEGNHVHTFTTDVKGGEQLTPGGPFVTRAFNNMPFTRLCTWFIKL